MMPIDKTNIKKAEILYWESINTSSSMITRILKNVITELKSKRNHLPKNSTLGYISTLKLNKDKKICSAKGKILSKEEKLTLVKHFIFMKPDEIQKYIDNKQIKQSTTSGKKNAMYRRYDNIDTKDLYRNIKKALGLNICPYCNRLFINTDGSHNLDHFFPRSLYPIFSICFYNLIPVCPACNNNKSNSTTQYFQNPYSDNYDKDSVTFHPILQINNDKMECTLNIKYKNEKNNGHKTLKSINQGYIDNIEYTIDRLRMYDLLQSPYLVNLLKLFSKEIQIHIPTLISLLLGRNIIENKINIRPFEKLDRDIHNDITKTH